MSTAIILFAAAVEQLPPVRVPHWLRAAFRRDLPLPARARIGLHVNLIAAGFIRDIGQPVPVGGKPWRRFVERCSEERLRLAVALSRSTTDVISRGGIDFSEGQQLPIRGPGHRNVCVARWLSTAPAPPLPSASCQKMFGGPSLFD